MGFHPELITTADVYVCFDTWILSINLLCPPIVYVVINEDNNWISLLLYSPANLMVQGIQVPSRVGSYRSSLPSDDIKCGPWKVSTLIEGMQFMLYGWVCHDVLIWTMFYMSPNMDSRNNMIQSADCMAYWKFNCVLAYVTNLVPHYGGQIYSCGV